MSMVEEAIICKFRAFFMVNVAIDEKQSGLTQLASCSSAAQHCAEPERSMNSLLSLKDDRRPVSSMTLCLMIKLLTVYDSFDVPGKGQVIVGRSEDKAVRLLAGQDFLLVLTNGERHNLKALGIAQFTKCFSDATQLGILIGEQLNTSAPLSDSEIWVEA
jgi:hypothetical protein